MSLSPRLADDLLRNRDALQSNLAEWLLGIAKEFEVAKQKMTGEVAQMSTELQEYANGLLVNAKVDGTSELESFRGQVKKMLERHLDALQDSFEITVEAGRDNIHKLTEKLCVETTDELELLKKRALANLNQRLISEIEETEKYVADRMDLIREHGTHVVDGVVKDLEKDLRNSAKDVVGQLELTIQSTRQKLETSMGIELKSQYDVLLNAAKRNLDNLLSQKVIEFSGQATAMVHDLSSVLKREMERKLIAARQECNLLTDAATRELQQQLAQMNEEIVSGLASTRTMLSELEEIRKRESRLRAVLVDIQKKVDTKSSNIRELEEAFTSQVVTAEQTLQNINTLVSKTENEVTGLEERAKTALQRARITIEKQIPARTAQLIAQGRSQAFLEAKTEATTAIHLVLRGLYAELRTVEREVYQQLELVKRQLKSQEVALRSTAKSGGESLIEWLQSQWS